MFIQKFFDPKWLYEKVDEYYNYNAAVLCRLSDGAIIDTVESEYIYDSYNTVTSVKDTDYFLYNVNSSSSINNSYSSTLSGVEISIHESSIAWVNYLALL